MCILDILTKRKAEGNEGYEESLPAIDQIRGFKRRFNSEGTDTEFEKVRELLNKLSGENRGLENLDEKSGFSYLALYINNQLNSLFQVLRLWKMFLISFYEVERTSLKELWSVIVRQINSYSIGYLLVSNGC
jgi:hypothetical protein